MDSEKKIELHVGEGTKEVVLRSGEAPEVFKNYKGFHYATHSTDSFIAMVKSIFDSNNGHEVIAYNDDGMQAIMDDTVKDREQDNVSYAYRYSLQFKEWESILIRATLDQKKFIKFLQRREDGEVHDMEALIYALQQNFRFVTNIEGDFSNSDNNNFTFAFKTKDGDGTVDIPKKILDNIEVYNESDFPQTMEIEFEVNKPQEAGQKPTFSITCPKLARYVKEATDFEVKKLKDAFKEYLVVSGKIF